VTYTFVDLDEALAELPTLRDVLGKDWINREKRTPPVESKFPLARTLRIRELRSLVISLDRRLRDLWNVKGAPDWRNRLRNNGQETRELLTEISFADLLWQRGYEFEHPDDGPDFAISIEGCSPLRVEACTPRIIGWDDDLDARLWMLGRQFDYSVEMEPAEAEVPILSAEVSERKMQHIVAVALGRLSSANIDRSYTTQLCSDIGLKIEWSPAAHPFFRKRDAPNSSPNRAFNYVWTAADKKAKQLRDANAHTLLIGTNQLPLSDWGRMWSQFATTCRITGISIGRRFIPKWIGSSCTSPRMVIMPTLRSRFGSVLARRQARQTNSPPSWKCFDWRERMNASKAPRKYMTSCSD
jgi:hypothetical protein